MSVFVLRALQVGLTLSDLDFMEFGEVASLLIEQANDGCEYQQVASQDDFDRF